ncbi:MAG: hypothetical protein ACI9FJ_003038, partial [Alteromonadaceae bacterium]
MTSKHASQLFRYFSVTNARLAILTNGAIYEFYTDLDAPNKMDEKPFLMLNLEDIDEHIVPEIKKLTKSSFDVDSVVDAAGELKYLSQIKKLIAAQFNEPEEEFVKFFASRVYEGMLTPKVKSQFQDITPKALKQFLNDSINERLKSAIGSDIKTVVSPLKQEPQQVMDNAEGIQADDVAPKLVTTEEEIEGFNIVKAILRQKVAADRITSRDTQSY